MRPTSDLRLRATMAAGALTTATLLAGPLAPRAAGASPQASIAVPVVSVEINDRTVRYGDPVIVSGRVSAARNGRDVILEHRTRRGTWETVARGVTRDRGAYRLRAVIPRSGLLRVSAPSVGAAATTSPTLVTASRERGLRVAARVSLRSRQTTVRSGRQARWTGRVQPGVAGRLVVLQSRSGGHWTTIARTRTRKGGAYSLRYRARGTYSGAVRVRASGTATLAAGARSAGRMAALRPALASWYGGGGTMACGAQLTGSTMGVAHKSLPCGTIVTIRYRGRQVRVPVTDRGPFIGPREFDLTSAVRARLGFEGVATIWVAY